MKKIRKSAAFLLLTCMLVCGLTACYGRNNNTVESTPVMETTVPNETATNNGNGMNADGSGGNERSTGGVIDGLMGDVSKGINDITGETLRESSTATGTQY